MLTKVCVNFGVKKNLVKLWSRVLPRKSEERNLKNRHHVGERVLVVRRVGVLDRGLEWRSPVGVTTPRAANSTPCARGWSFALS